MNTHRIAAVTLMLSALLLTGCAEQTTVSSTATPPSSSTTPTFSPTPTPTPTPPPATSTPIPSIQVNSDPLLSSLTIVSTVEGNIWIAKQGKITQLTSTGNDSTPILSPDGEFVIFTRNRMSEKPEDADDRFFPISDLLFVRADGTDERVLIPAEDLYFLIENLNFIYGIGVKPISVLGSNPYVLFSTISNNRDPRNADLFFYELDSNTLTQLVETDEGGLIKISPDERWIAIANHSHVQLISIGDWVIYPNILTYQPVHDGPPYTYNPTMQWSQDSKHLWVISEAGDREAGPTDYQNEIWKIDVDTKTPTLINNFHTSSVSRSILTGKLSPDLRYVVYAHPDSSFTDELFLTISNLTGTITTDFQPQGKYFEWLGWSPDSNHFLYYSYPDSINIGSIAPQSLTITQTNFPARYVRNILWVNEKQVILTWLNLNETTNFLLNIETQLLLMIKDLPEIYDFIFTTTE